MRFLLLATLLVPTLAFADAKPTESKTDDCARARKANKTCVLDIGEENIEGSTPKGSGFTIDARKFATLNSLIHIRKDFIPEIVKEADNID